MTIKKTLSLFTAAAAMGLAVPAFAGTVYTWIGGSSGAAAWDKTGRWSPSGVPGAGDTVIFQNSDVVTFSTNLPSALAEIDVNGAAQLTLAQASLSMTVGTIALTTTSTSSLTFGSSMTVTASTAVNIDPSTTLVLGASDTLVLNGTMILKGTFTPTGTFTNSSGVLQIENGMNADLMSGQAGTTHIHSNCATSGAYTVGGPLVIDPTYVFTPGGALTNSNAISIGGSGADLVLNSASNSNGASATITIASGGKMEVNNTFTNSNTSACAISVTGELVISGTTFTNNGKVCVASGGLVRGTGAAPKMDGSDTLTLSASTSELRATNCAFTLDSALNLVDASGAIWGAESPSSAATLIFKKSHTSMVGDFRLADTSSLFQTDAAITTSGSYFGSYSVKCDGLAGSAARFTWTGTSGYSAGHCN